MTILLFFLEKEFVLNNLFLNFLINVSYGKYLNQQNNHLINSYLYCDNRKKEQYKRTSSKFPLK